MARSRRWALGLLMILAGFAATVIGQRPSHAAQNSDSAKPSLAADLARLSLEDLGQIKVTSVSRKSESLSSAPAAVFVITQEDIRRSGVTSLPEALRMAPGLEVAQANSHQWAISSRGFNGVFANKLLVLMDGRSIYTPLFSGVFWEEADTVLEDVDRIEVIRGPGAALWGANAVNGVINLITKSAKETQGLLLSGGGGIEERGFGAVRYGGQLSSNLFYRVYGKYSNHDDSTLVEGGSTGDRWSMAQEGFRLDWEATEANRLTLQADYYQNHSGSRVYLSSFNPVSLVPTPIRSKAEGVNLLTRWTHEFSSESDLALQLYYDRTDRGFGVGSEIRNTFDLDLQHRFAFGERNEFVWGGEYRVSADEIGESPDFRMSDPSASIQWLSAFVQDEIALVPSRLHFTLGTKLEHSDFAGLEVQPSARIAWTPSERHTFWGAVSRAVRTPSRGERGFSIFGEPPNLLRPLPAVPLLIPFAGNPDFQSEELLAYEIGYRVQPHPRFSADWTAFYHDYDDLRSTIPLPLELRVSPVPYLAIPATVNNDLYGESYGTEISARWQPLDAWRLRAAYSFLGLQLHARGPVPSLTEIDEGLNPQHQLTLWSDFDLGRQVEWGVGLRYVGELPTTPIAAYVAFDTRLAWKPTPRCELAIIGRNLFDPHHREYPSEIITYRLTEVDRAVYAKVTWRF